MFTFSAPLHRQLQPELQLIEVWTALAIPSFRVVGLPGPEIIESCERVRAAIEASGLEFPRKRVLVNLSPAGVRKQGTGTDLAIALAVMAHSMEKSDGTRGKRPPSRRIVASGELSLDGTVRSSGRILRTLMAALESEATDIVLSGDDRESASRALSLLGATRLRVHLIDHLIDGIELLQSHFDPARAVVTPQSLPLPSPDTRDLLTLPGDLERTLGIAAAGAHHLLLLGPKGTGKTAALQWMHALQAPLSNTELLESLLMEELLQPRTPLVRRHAPVRVVSPQIRPEALMGGVHRGELRPGECSQAHGGTLVADEFLEWPRDARECLRDPMESGRIHLLRAQLRIDLPARFQLAASANLCRCGGWPRAWRNDQGPHASHRTSLCRCTDTSREDYLSRLSGPILDRIDLVQLVTERPESHARTESAVQARQPEFVERVERCRESLKKRWGKPPGRLSAGEVETILDSEPRIAEIWKDTPRPREASLRRRHKEMRVALTLAAWDPSTSAPALPERRHFREAQRGSAESWLHSLFRTELRSSGARARSAVDPSPPAV